MSEGEARRDGEGVVRRLRLGRRVEVGSARIAAALGLCVATGVLAAGSFRSVTAAQPASWSADGGPSQSGHDLTPVALRADGTAMAIGGFDPNNPTSTNTTVETLAPGAGQWVTAPSGDQLPGAYAGKSLIGAQATVLRNGDILLTGGRDETGAAIAQAAVWDHTQAHRTGSQGADWFPLTMNQARAEHVAVALRTSSRAVVVGGDCAEVPDTEVFEETGSTNTTGEFVAGGCSYGDGHSLHTWREQAAAVVTSTDAVIITGGLKDNPAGCATANGAATAEVDVMSPQTLHWTPAANDMSSAASLPAPGAPSSPPPQASDNCPAATSPASNGARLRHTATELENAAKTQLAIVVAGGAAVETFTARSDQAGLQAEQASFVDDSTEVYTAPVANPGSGTWQAGQSLSSPRVDAAAAPLGGAVLLAGGRGEGGTENDPAMGTPGIGLSETVLYDPGSRSFAPTAPMTTGRYDFALAPTSSGQVLAAGGFAGQSSGIQFALTAELYTPASASTVTPPPATPTPSGSARPTQRPTFNPGQHNLVLSLPVVREGAPLTVTANGFSAGQQVLLVLQPASVNSLQACGVGLITKVTVGTDGKISQTLLIVGQGSPQLAVTLCVVGPPPGAPAGVSVAQAVGRVSLLVQHRSEQPPFVSLPGG